jgi:hypothetical protein
VGKWVVNKEVVGRVYLLQAVVRVHVLGMEGD